jgi:purine-binding chemotaxis protein CheW
MNASTTTTAPARESKHGEPCLYVVFKVGGVSYALPAEEVLQLESYSGATAVPSARGFVKGVIQLRGRVVPVVDLRARFGLPPAEPTLESRVVVAEKDGRCVALLADSAREVLRIAPAQRMPPPRLVGDNGFVRSVVQLEGRTILVLDLDKVIGEGTEPSPRREETIDV